MLRRLSQVLACLLVLLAAVAGWTWVRVRASLPQVDGQLTTPGLSAAVTVTRDALGIPTIAADSFHDAVLAHGFVHAQDRFFQMDLSRRGTAGELAELFGERALEADLRVRRRQRRRAAARLLASLDPEARGLVEAYTVGVNAGLSALGAPPPEYLLLRLDPEVWLAEDTLLVNLGFFDMLSSHHRREKPLAVMEAVLPLGLVDFLTPSTSRWDSPLIEDETGGWSPFEIPGPGVVDLRGLEPASFDQDVVRPAGMALGSNNWAVDGDLTGDGRAILANDPHLGLRVPHVWHRVEFVIAGRRIVGVGAPGLPGVVIGSNGDLAWGATNSFADQTDFVVVETTSEGGRYLTAEGDEAFERVDEVVAVKGAQSVALDVLWTRWGPVIDEDWQGRPLAERSPVHDVGGLNLNLLGLMEASTLEAAVAVVDSWRGPGQNWMLATADGRVGWVVNGPIPVRRGFTGKTPVSWARSDVGWIGERPGPRLLDPVRNRLHTANGRTVPHDDRPLTHFWIHSGRSQRIDQLLSERDRWDEASLRTVQLDVRSDYHRFAADVVLEVTDAGESDAVIARFRELVEAWDGTADVDESAFDLLGRLADALVDGVLEPLLAPAVGEDPGFVLDWSLADEPARRILEERPEHLVPPPHSDWDAFLRSVVESTAAAVAAEPGGLDRSWAEVRQVALRHPLGGLPILGRYLNMPASGLPGWAGSVRAQTRSYGASMRLVVSPGHEEEGLLHMPTGQSGHFLSPNYSDSHAAWVEGLATPLLAGDPVASLRLVPE